jgi:polyribonucleotide nucleotidyltransferase
MVIGPGGKNIKAIIAETGVKIDVEDNGTVKIFSPDQNAINRAVELVEMYTDDVQVGKVYKGMVKKIVEFGAFVEVIPKKTDGLLHISQISDRRLAHVTDVLHEGDLINIQVLAVENGKIRLTMKGVSQDVAPSA